MKLLLDPKQELFLSLYTDPKSDTFSNATQSALKAGYSKEYSETITSQMPDWLAENLGDMKRLRKAEKNLSEVQDLSIINEEGIVDVQLIDKRSKVDIFLAKSLNKAKYSEKIQQEHTNPDGNLKTIIINKS